MKKLKKLNLSEVKENLKYISVGLIIIFVAVFYSIASMKIDLSIMAHHPIFYYFFMH